MYADFQNFIFSFLDIKFVLPVVIVAFVVGLLKAGRGSSKIM